MKVDVPLLATDLAVVGTEAREIERLGHDGAFTFEGPHDPFLPLVLAAEHTTRLELATAIALAFPRSPMQLAYLAHDLQLQSQGRLIVGLGSQVKAHIERRYGAVWSRPRARMREFVLALRAIWRAWNEHERLSFQGEFYRHTLMTPLFSPDASAWGPPRVFLAGVGAPMTAAAGEVADGLFVHPLNSPEFIRGTTLPALAKGFARAGRTREGFVVAVQALVVTGFTEDEMRAAETATRLQLAFYGSTPQYRVVLDTHGVGALQPELHRLAREGRWVEMGGLIDDSVLDAFTVRCPPGEVAARLRARYGGLADRIAVICHSHPERSDPGFWAGMVAELKRA